MFRRLAETFQNEDIITQYTNQQNKYFNTLPNMIPSGTSGLKGFDTAIQSLNPLGTDYQDPAVKYPNDIFKKDSSPNLNEMAKQCAASSIDELIAIKNPNASIGCGWIYTPPNQGSPYPNVSQGVLGTPSSPLPNFLTADYKKYFFDLQVAKKQMLLDKCKALNACTDVDSNVFNGVCGYCTDTNQGVPIDATGQPLYGSDPRGNCSSQSLITTGAKCPVDTPATSGSINGPQPIVDKTCVPVDGRLSADCLRSKLLSAGCADNGALAIALASPSSPSNYIANITDNNTVKIYNRVANPPIKLDIFQQGATTVDIVLKEARQLAANATHPANTSLGAAARDLCLQSGTMDRFDFCSDLSDASTAPFDVGCLQKLFKKMGGLPLGTAYPSEKTIQTYNTLGNLGAVKQYINTIIGNTKSEDYNIQRTAMIQLFGIVPESMIVQPPRTQGVEVFWFVPAAGSPNKITGFLRRTIETNFIQLGGEFSSPSGVIPQIGLSGYSAMLQMANVRTPNDFSTKFKVTVDDGFWLSVNRKADIDRNAYDSLSIDNEGLFASLKLQGATTYQSESCFKFKKTTPNIVKMYYHDAGGGQNGGHWFTFNLQPCADSGKVNFAPDNFYLTCEPRAPFLTYEISQVSGRFEELRNPGTFSWFLGEQSVEKYFSPEERSRVPGNKPFMRLNSANSLINMPNIAFQSWGTVTFAIRLKSMPVKDTLINFQTSKYYYSVIAQPTNGSTANLSVEHNFGGEPAFVSTGNQLSLDKWYLIFVANKGTGFDLFCVGIDEMVQNRSGAAATSINANGPLYSQNMTMDPAPGQTAGGCSIMLGTKNYMKWYRGMYSTSSFNYDLAWVHFFDHYTNGDDIYRDCKANWIYTQFPDSEGKYKTM